MRNSERLDNIQKFKFVGYGTCEFVRKEIKIVS